MIDASSVIATLAIARGRNDAALSVSSGVGLATWTAAVVAVAYGRSARRERQAAFTCLVGGVTHAAVNLAIASRAKSPLSLTVILGSAALGTLYTLVYVNELTRE